MFVKIQFGFERDSVEIDWKLGELKLIGNGLVNTKKEIGIAAYLKYGVN